jgi:hypothetical protein
MQCNLFFLASSNIFFKAPPHGMAILGVHKPFCSVICVSYGRYFECKPQEIATWLFPKSQLCFKS